MRTCRMTRPASPSSRGARGHTDTRPHGHSHTDTQTHARGHTDTQTHTATQGTPVPVFFPHIGFNVFYVNCTTCGQVLVACAGWVLLPPGHRDLRLLLFHRGRALDREHGEERPGRLRGGVSLLSEHQRCAQCRGRGGRLFARMVGKEFRGCQCSGVGVVLLLPHLSRSFLS